MTACSAALRHLVTVRAGQAPLGETVHPLQDGIDGVPFIQGNAEFGERHPSPRFIAEAPPKIAPSGSVLVSVRAPVGALNVADVELGIGRGVAALIPRPGIDGRFLWWAMHAMGAALQSAATGTTYPSVDAGALGSLGLPHPSLDEQRRIADFLDRECERIGAARDGLDRLAERALEPAVALAERAWGEHRLGKIGYAFEVQLGKMLYEGRIDHATAKPYLRIANVYWDRFELDDVKRMNFDGAEAAFYALRPGDLLVCEGRGLGRSAVWDAQITPCYFQKALNRVRPYGLDSTRWVMWCLRVLNRRGAFLGDAPGVPHVTAEQLRATRIPLPDPGTQHRLVAEIDAEAERGKRLSALAYDAHGRLAEYRDALITEAATGQLDVSRVSDGEMDERAHAALEAPPSLPRTSPEPHPPDPLRSPLPISWPRAW